MLRFDLGLDLGLKANIFGFGLGFAARPWPWFWLCNVWPLQFALYLVALLASLLLQAPFQCSIAEVLAVCVITQPIRMRQT